MSFSLPLDYERSVPYESWATTLEGAERLANIKKQLFTMTGDDAVEAHDMVNAMFMELLHKAHSQIIGDK